jgi:hypothetical protein
MASSFFGCRRLPVFPTGYNKDYITVFSKNHVFVKKKKKSAVPAGLLGPITGRCRKGRALLRRLRSPGGAYVRKRGLTPLLGHKKRPLDLGPGV